MSLLTNSQWNKFRSSVNSVLDTFAVVPVQLERTEEAFSRFGEGAAEGAFYDLEGYPSFDPTESEEDEYGREDVSEGKIFFKYDALDQKGLIDGNKHPKIDAERDHLYLYGREYRMTFVRNAAVIRNTPAMVEVGVRIGPEKH